MAIKVESLLNQTPDNFFLIAGPCVVESEDLCMEVATKVKALCEDFKIPYVFKASYRKANRSRRDSFTGIGDETALNIIKKVGKQLNLPTTTDIHTDEEAGLAAQYVDILQIPAFLCRQTSLLEAAADTGKIVNIKKGQFLNHASIRHAMNKVIEAGNPNVILTERGNSFGYQDLVVDFMGVKEMQSICDAVVVDCTHSLQRPNQGSGVTGGKPEYIGTMASCAIAAGANGLFIETHPDPSKALSDGANMLALDKLESLLEKLVRIRRAVIND
ncbi:3-deoxy-8-phosphooctulonate synthase [Portibacter lacus]|uniref:3-deoxy-8-phosphooctulonate synthase n=1 Tax=Portibacter lacus TaxID=1099794 RepID=A0AA37SK49_9BACT|nr:3-deoxy-8-phosphooctulonate synthase [Portibacter lacus]GLR16058.1 2-dehydro-3-deoxyphosphooctonate aldolase [Portibacter lacus]